MCRICVDHLRHTATSAEESRGGLDTLAKQPGQDRAQSVQARNIPRFREERATQGPKGSQKIFGKPLLMASYEICKDHWYAKQQA